MPGKRRTGRIRAATMRAGCTSGAWRPTRRPRPARSAVASRRAISPPGLARLHRELVDLAGLEDHGERNRLSPRQALGDGITKLVERLGAENGERDRETRGCAVEALDGHAGTVNTLAFRLALGRGHLPLEAVRVLIPRHLAPEGVAVEAARGVQSGPPECRTETPGPEAHDTGAKKPREQNPITQGEVHPARVEGACHRPLEAVPPVPPVPQAPTPTPIPVDGADAGIHGRGRRLGRRRLDLVIGRRNEPAALAVR